MVYKYKATLPDNKIFLREYEIQSDTNLYKLHEYLENDLGFSPDQMVVFQGIDTKGKVVREYGLFDSGDGSMDSITLKSSLSKGDVVLRYLYNLIRNRYIVLTFISIEEEISRVSYPRLVKEKGPNPDQFSDKYEDFGELDDEKHQTLSSKFDGQDEEVYDDDELPEGEEER